MTSLLISANLNDYDHYISEPKKTGPSRPVITGLVQFSFGLFTVLRLDLQTLTLVPQNPW
jgi:hypothetical protein